MAEVEQISETPIPLDGLTLRDGWVIFGTLKAVGKILEGQGHGGTVGTAAVAEAEKKLAAAIDAGIRIAGLDTDEVLDAFNETMQLTSIFKQENR